jgi:predicted TIM-barrel fold metal-dependent hydrolase
MVRPDVRIDTRRQMHPGPIDVQTHFLPRPVVDAMTARSEPPRVVETSNGRLVEYGPGGAYPLLPEMVDAATKLEHMDRAGLGASVLSVNLPGVDLFDPANAVAIAREANDELLELVAAHPDRLAAFATLPMQRPEDAAAELARAYQQGCCGAMLYSNVAESPLDEERFRVVFDEAARLGAPVLIHPTYPLSAPTLQVHAFVPVVGFLFDTTTATLRLIFDGIYERHPDFKLILGHAGSLIPYFVGRIDYESSRLPNGLGALQSPPSEHIRKLYVDTVSAWPPALELVASLLGVDRVLYATDHPFWDPDRTRDALAKMTLSDAERAGIERDNAISLLGLASG